MLCTHTENNLQETNDISINRITGEPQPVVHYIYYTVYIDIAGEPTSS